MRLRCIACDALARPVYWSAALSPNIVDIELVERGLHNTPKILQDHLQQRIDSADKSQYDAVALVYGLCGQATAGLRAGKIPLIVPRAHDCITLFLGSRVAYRNHFDQNPGTYWYVQDYIERQDGSGGPLSIGAGNDSTDLEVEYQSYVEKYGKDNADYLMAVMGGWKKHYQRAIFIDLGFGDSSRIKNIAKIQAAERGWNFDEMIGDLVLIRKLLDTNWAEELDPDFLFIPPGQFIRMTYDENIISCALLRNENQ
jgi:hypothetical protein